MEGWDGMESGAGEWMDTGVTGMRDEELRGNNVRTRQEI